MILDRFWKRGSLENPSTSLSNPADWLSEIFGGAPTAAGVTVNPETAMTYASVFVCVRIIAETVGQLPFHLYRRLPGGGAEPATDHPAYGITHDTPNDVMTGAVLRETTTGHIATWGNGVAQIIRGRGGRLQAIMPVQPNSLEVHRTDAGVIYRGQTLDSDTMRPLGAADVYHVPGFGFDGLVGYSPITLQKQAIALGMAATEYGARFFSQGATPIHALKVPGELSDGAFKRLRDSWAAAHSGKGNAYKPAILEQGTDIASLSLPPGDAQFLETRKFERAEVCGIYRVPLHMAGDLERATFSNIEHQSLDFVRGCLLPYLVKAEQEANRKFLLPSERGSLFFKHEIEGLLRGDTKSRYSAYHFGIHDGWLSRNEVRRLEDLPPIDGLDEVLTPVNMQMEGSGEADPEKEQENDARNAPSIEAFLPLIRSAMRRIRGRKVSGEDQKQRDYVRKQLTPILDSIALHATLDSAAEVVAEYGLELLEIDPDIADMMEIVT